MTETMEYFIKKIKKGNCKHPTQIGEDIQMSTKMYDLNKAHTILEEVIQNDYYDCGCEVEVAYKE